MLSSHLMPQQDSQLIGYISAVDAAKLFGMSNDHVASLVRKGKVEGMLLGRVRFVKESSLKEYCAAAEAEKALRKANLSNQIKSEYIARGEALATTPAPAPVAAATPSPIALPAPIAAVVVVEEVVQATAPVQPVQEVYKEPVEIKESTVKNIHPAVRATEHQDNQPSPYYQPFAPRLSKGRMLAHRALSFAVLCAVIGAGSAYASDIRGVLTVVANAYTAGAVAFVQGTYAMRDAQSVGYQHTAAAYIGAANRVAALQNKVASSVSLPSLPSLASLSIVPTVTPWHSRTAPTQVLTIDAPNLTGALAYAQQKLEQASTQLQVPTVQAQGRVAIAEFKQTASAQVQAMPLFAFNVTKASQNLAKANAAMFGAYSAVVGAAASVPNSALTFAASAYTSGIQTFVHGVYALGSAQTSGYQNLGAAVAAVLPTKTQHANTSIALQNKAISPNAEAQVALADNQPEPTIYLTTTYVPDQAEVAEAPAAQEPLALAADAVHNYVQNYTAPAIEIQPLQNFVLPHVDAPKISLRDIAMALQNKVVSPISRVAIASGNTANVWDAWTSWLASVFYYPTAPARTYAVAQPTPTKTVVVYQTAPASNLGVQLPSTPTQVKPAQVPSTAPLANLSAYVTQSSLDTQFNQLSNNLKQLIYANAGSVSSPQSSSGQGGAVGQGNYNTGGITNNIALTNIIDQLNGVAISNSTLNNTIFTGSVSGITAASLPLINLSSGVQGLLAIGSGGTGTSTAPSYGQLLLGDGSGGYNFIGTSSLGFNVLPYFASSTIGGGTQTSGLTINGGATTTGILTVGNGITGTIKLGDATISKTSGGNFTLAANLYASGLELGNSSSNAIIFSDSTSKPLDFTLGNGSPSLLRLAQNGLLGLGTTSPFSKFAIHANNGDTNTTLFAIASSTSNSTTTLFSVSNTGNVAVGNCTPGIYQLCTTGGINAGGQVTGTSISTGGNIQLGNSFALFWSNRSQFTSSADGLIALSNNNATDFTRLQFGGTTSAFPSLARNGTSLNIIAADGSLIASHGIGTTSPYATLAVHAANGSTNTTLFAIASSTASATTTLLSVSNTGQVQLNAGIAASSNTTGTLVVTGGIGVSGLVYGGGGGVFGNQVQSSGASAGFAAYSNTGYFAAGAFPGDTFISRASAGVYQVGTTATNANGTLLAGAIGVGTTSPFAQFALHAANGSTNTTLFAIASSTQNATSTLFSISNTGNILATSTALLQFGGTTSSWAALGKLGASNTTLAVLLADSSNFGNFAAGNLNATANLNLGSGGALAFTNSASNPAQAGSLDTGISRVSAGVLAVGNGTQGSSAGTLIANTIGVGTTSPFAQFAVHAANGSTKTTLFAIASSTASATSTLFTVDNTGLATITSAGGNGLVVSASGATRLTVGINTILNSGNLGIGVAPQSKLDVNGGVAIGSYAGVNAAPSNGLIVSGNVGIGTSTPTNKLQVFGGALEVNGAYTSPINPSGSVILSQESTFAQLQSFNSKPLALNPLGNNVGIGTTNPYGPLTVRATNAGAYAQGINLDVNDATLGSAIGIDFNLSTSNLGISAPGARIQAIRVASGAGGDIAFSTRNGGSSILSEVLRLAQTGNVGVGTTSPYALTSIHANNGGTNTTLFAIASSTQNATTKLFAISNTGALTVTGAATFNSTLNASTLTGTTIFANNQLTVGVGGGAIALQNPATNVLSLDTFTTGNLSRIDIGGTTSAFPSLARNGTSLNVIAADGSLIVSHGVGTTSPYATLAVHAANGSTNTTLFAIASSTQSATTTLFAVTNTGQVGIGTATPTHNLQILSNVAIADTNLNAQLYIQNTLATVSGHASVVLDKGTTGAAASFGFNTAGVQQWDVGTLDNNNFQIRTLSQGGGATNKVLTIEHGASANSLYINSVGNVGIGSTTPYGQLSVKATGSNIGLVVQGSNGAANLQQWFSSTGSLNAAIGDNGSFGIKDGSRLYLDGADQTGQTYITESGGVNLVAGAGRNVIFSAGAGEVFRASSNGNVGVGTTSPFALTSIHAQNGSTNTTLFAIASSTQSATTTLFSVSNTGVATIGGSINVASSNSNVIGNVSFFSGGSTAFNGGTLSNVGAVQASNVGGQYLTLTSTNATGGLIFGASTQVEAARITPTGNFGIGSTSPYGKLAINLNNGDTNTLAFNIASSTSNSTTTLFSIDNIGNATIGKNITFNGSFLLGNIAGGFAITNAATSGTIPNFAPNKSDLTTGIGANQAGVISLITAGTEKLTITNAGKIGIGTTSPWAQLSVQVNNSNGIGYLMTGTASDASVDNTAGVALVLSHNVAGNRQFTLADSLSGLGVRILANGIDGYNYLSNTRQDLFLGTNSTNVSINGTWFQGSTGNVGVGTSTPYALLSIGGSLVRSPATTLFAIASSTGNATSTYMTIDANGFLAIGSGAGGPNTNIAPGSTLQLGNSGVFAVDSQSGTTTISNLSLGNIVFDTNAGMVGLSDLPVDSGAALGTIQSQSISIGGNPLITAGGKADGAGGLTNLGVAIGTSTNPYAMLHVVGADNAAGTLAFLASNQASTSLFAITNAGNVGIGTSSPMSQFTVAGGHLLISNNFYFQGLDTSGNTRNLLGMDTLNNTRLIAGSSGLNVLASDQSTSRLFINSAGNVGVGTTSPYALTSIHAANGSTNTTLFAIASSTASATTTLFSVNNIGQTSVTSDTGTFGRPTLRFGETNTSAGFYNPSGGGGINVTNSSNIAQNFNTQYLGNVSTVSGGSYTWTVNSNNAQQGNDTGLSRLSAGVVAVGTGAQGSVAGTLIANIIGVGTSTPGANFAVNGNGYFTNAVGIGSTRTVPGLTTSALAIGNVLSCTGSQALQTDGS
ncbi:MAG: hypothetical protein JWL71_5152, partial [Acidobacteria bacterium]|nr:hypothetical protein [Acidobacteriota bacterium]